MQLWKLVACGLIWAAPAIGQEAGECLTLKEAGELAHANGDIIVDNRQTPNGLHMLVRRVDGSFKHLIARATAQPVTPETVVVCHVKNFPTDPRVPGVSS